MATGGNLRIDGDEDKGDSDPNKMELVIRDEEAGKVLFFFSRELHNDAEKHDLEFKISNDGQQIQFLAKETNKRVSVAVVERLRSLVEDKLKHDVISGNSEDTLYNVIQIIRNCKLKTKVLPLQSKQNSEIIRIFGMREEELDTIKSAYENPDNLLAEKPSMFHETRVMSQSQGGRAEDRDSDPNKMELVIRDEEAEKVLFFFSLELHNDAEKHDLEFKISYDGQQIQILAKETNKRISVAVVERLRSLVKDKLKHDVISGNSEDTLYNVMQIIRNCKLKTKVLPLQSKQNREIIRIFGMREEELDTIKSAYENPDNLLAEQPSMFYETRVMSQSQGGRAEDRGIGSFTQMDVKYEFDTKEGLHVKLYKKAITKLNVDAIVNTANDKLANIGGVAEVIEKAAGSQLKRECKDIIRTERKIQEGNNVTTTAGNLNYKAVIHAVGPRWHDHQDKSQCLNILRDTIINIMKTARREGYKSVAMPPISSGIFGVPKQMCAAMYLKGILDFSSMNDRGRLGEFHIIAIHDDVLDMVKDWHEQMKVNPRCLECSEVLTKVTDNWKQGKSNNRHHWGTEENNGRHVAGEKSLSGFTNSLKDKDKGNYYRYPSKEQYNDKRQYILRRFCGKTTDILIYATDILQLKGIDVIAVSEDPSVTGQGTLSRVLLDAGDLQYRKEHSKLQPYFLTRSTSKVMLTSAGNNLPFHHVLHAVIRRKGEFEYLFQTKLKETYTNILESANQLVNKPKSKKVSSTTINLALPMIGIGTPKDTEVLRHSCWTLVEAITKFLQTSKTCHIREIHLINNNENIIKMLQETFIPKTEKCPPPPTPKPNFTKPHHKDQYDTPKSSKKIETWKMDSTAQMKTDVSKYMKSYKHVVIYGDGNPPVDEDNCIICLSEMDDPVELVECKHVFCKECIMKGFGSKPSCPVCGKVYGIVYGDQPRDGTADIFEEEDSLPGYDRKKTYVIYYDFPPGKQENFHPQPGKRYDGMRRSAFLPKNQEGTAVLELLRKAFEQGLTFTVGTSRTTGKEGVLTWNHICHKTSRAGGPRKFGYPDPEYLSRVKEELACKGITDDA